MGDISNIYCRAVENVLIKLKTFTYR